jgi:glycosyltransferase involved in cell wall biosynthesis
MVPVKDHKTFIAAAALLAERRADLHFVVVGGGELSDEVQRDIAARGLSQRAHLLGWQKNLAPIYADLDVVALSSVNEGTPVALIEAMAAGVPVAATAVGGVPDVVARRGELCAPGDPVALADAIQRALAPEARERAARMRAEILSAFSAERLCADLADLYESCQPRRAAVAGGSHAR